MREEEEFFRFRGASIDMEAMKCVRLNNQNVSGYVSPDYALYPSFSICRAAVTWGWPRRFAWLSRPQVIDQWESAPLI